MELLKVIRIIKKQIPLVLIGMLLASGLSYHFRSYPIENMPRYINYDYTRYNSEVLEKYLKEIKDRSGILILGTSETFSGLGGDMYWEADIANRPVYVLGGAEHPSYTWIPMLIKNKELLKEVSILYYANPIYWTKKENKFHKLGFERYVSLVMLDDIDRGLLPQDIEAIFDKYDNKYRAVLKWQTLYWQRIFEDYLDALFASIKSNYKFFLRNHCHPVIIDYSKRKRYSGQENDLIEKYDSEVNVLKAWSGRFRKGLGPIIEVENAFQNEALKDFIGVAKWAAIDLIIFVGPYNYKLSKKRSPHLNKKYEQVQKKIIEISEQESISYIDGSDLNQQHGFFQDQMHQSYDLGNEYLLRKLEKYYENN